MKGSYIFNDVIDFSKIGTTGDFISKIPFMSKNTRFDSLDIDVSSGVIRYNNIDVYTSQGWVNQKYKTITLFEEQDENEWSPNQSSVEQWILANSTTVRTKKRVKLTKTKEDGTSDKEEVYPKAYVTDLINEDGSQWIPSLGGSGGMGGGSGAVSITTITNPELVTSLGVKTELEFEWSSEADGNGSLYIYVDGELKKTTLAKQGNVKVDVSNYITSATEYLVRLVVEDAFGSKRALNYQISVINLIVNSTFDQTLAQTGTITYRYTPYGNVTKTMHFIIDDAEYTTEVAETGREKTFEIPNGTLTHGVHSLKVYATATFGETTVYSNELNYKFAYYQEGNSTPIIVIFNEPNQTFDEGQTVKINYLVYTATSETTDITLYLNGQSQSLTVDRQAKVWPINDYTIGINTIKIATDVNYETTTFNIVASEITINPVTTGLQLYLSSANKSNNVSSRNEWTYNDITTTFNNFNFVSDGWLEDSDRIVGLKMTADANIEIGFKPFGDDAKANGKTIELEFATSNVTNFDATVINIMSGNRGLIVKPNEVIFKSSEKEVSTRFKEEEHIRISLVIERSTANRFISVYINGVLSGIDVYEGSDDFQQTTPVNIKAGSTECDLTLYKIRCYSNSLTASNVLDNYIADNDNYDLKTKLFRRNQIYDAYGTVLYNKVKNIMPVLLITAPILPSAKDEVQKLTSLKLENINNPQLNWEYTNLDFEIQGTSSVQYPVKNLEFMFGEDVIQLYPDAILENRLTLKVDYASSAGVFNMGNAKIVNGIYQEKNPRQEEDSRVRNALYGYPVAVFYRRTPSDNWQFHCKGSLNLSKKAKAMGYKVGDESWETKNNTSPLCLFNSDDFSTLAEDFEARYNESGSSANLEALISWVYSCKDNPTKFRDECEDHFNLHYLLMYYVYGQIMGGADSYAKNLYLGFFAEGQNEDGTYYGKWYPEFYDLDTSYGIDNTGRLKFEYSTELNDKVEDRYAFNGHDSVLWNLVQEAYANELKTLYQTLRNGKIVTYDSIMEILQVQGIEQYPEAIYNEDAEIKYIIPYLQIGENYLSTALGSTLEHLKYWVSNRLKYLDSKWIASDYSTDRIVTRITTPENITPDYSITLKSRNDMYMQVQYGSYYANQRATRNVQYTLTPDIPAGTVFNDTEAYIYGASTLTSVGDLSKWYVTLLDISKATSLTELKVGDSAADYSNDNLKTFTAGANTLLRSIDLTNCTGLTGGIDLSQCSNLQYLYASGTQLTSVSFANGGQLKIAVLPDTITSMTLINLTSIQSIITTGVYSTIRIENSNVDSLDYVNKSIAASKLERLRLIGINWTIESKDMLDYLIANVKGINSIGNNQDKSVLSGKIHITGSIYSDEITAFREYWGTSLTITADTIIERFRCRFYDYDGTLLYQTSVFKGESVAYIGRTPHRPIDEANKIGYLFAGWDKSQNNIQKDTDFYPVFNAKPMVKATFVNYDGTVLYVDEVIAGTKAEYGGLTPEKPRDYDLQIKYVFKEWSPNINVAIEDNTTFTPVFDEVGFYKVEWQNYDGTVLETDYVDYNQKATYDGETPTRPTDAQYIYTFSGWSPNPENTLIVTNTTFTAGYTLKALCKVTLKNADGTVFDEIGVGNGEQFDYHSTPTPPADDAQFSNYEFASWQLNGEDVTLPITVTTNITLTPRFEGTLRKYSVFWYVDGELMETDVGVDYGTVGVTYDGVTPESPNEGFKFVGWNTTPDAEEAIDITTYQVVGDTYLYAVFQDPYNSYTEMTVESSYSAVCSFYVGKCIDKNDTNRQQTMFIDWGDGNGYVQYDADFKYSLFPDGKDNASHFMYNKIFLFSKISSPSSFATYTTKTIKIKWFENQVLGCSDNDDFISSNINIKKIVFSPMLEYLSGYYYDKFLDKNTEYVLPDNLKYIGIAVFGGRSNHEFNFPKGIMSINSDFNRDSVFSSSVTNNIVNFPFSIEEANFKITRTYGTDTFEKGATKITFNNQEYDRNSTETIEIDCENKKLPSFYFSNGLWKNKFKVYNAINIPASMFKANNIYSINSDINFVFDFRNITEISNSSSFSSVSLVDYNYNGETLKGCETVYLKGNENLGTIKSKNIYIGISFNEYITTSGNTILKSENVYFNNQLLSEKEIVIETSPTRSYPLAGLLFEKVTYTMQSSNTQGLCGRLPNLEEAYFPNGTSISSSYLFSESGIEEYIFDSTNRSYGGNLFKDCKKLNTVDMTNIYTGITRVGEYWFSGCSSLTNITLPNNITKIGQNAFYYCTSLKSITLPTSLTEISYNVFYGSGLENINIPEGVTRLYSYVFRSCSSLTLIVLPSSITAVDSQSIYDDNIVQNKTVVFKGTTPPTFNSSAFNSTYFNAANGCKIIVPTDAVDTYKGTTNLTQYADIIEGGAENYV